MTSEKKDIFSVTIIDKDNSHKMSFNHFENLMKNIKELLLSTANLTVTNSPIDFTSKQESINYLDMVNILPPKDCCFDTCIEIPSDQSLRKPTLYDEELNSNQVNERLMDVVEFLNQNAYISQPTKVTQDFIINNKKFISIKVYRSILNILKKTGAKNIVFSIKDSSFKKVRDVIYSDINDQNISFVNTFIDDMTNILESSEYINKTGIIRKFSSVDVTKDNNHVIIICRGEKTELIDITLNRKQYKEAMRIHEKGLEVRVRGYANVLSTKFNMIELESFEVVNENKELVTQNLDKQISLKFDNLYKSNTFSKDWQIEGIEQPNIYCENRAKLIFKDIFKNHNLYPKRIAPSIEEGILLFYRNDKKELNLEVYNDQLDIAIVISDGDNIIYSQDIEGSEDFNFTNAILKFNEKS